MSEEPAGQPGDIGLDGGVGLPVLDPPQVPRAAAKQAAEVELCYAQADKVRQGGRVHAGTHRVTRCVPVSDSMKGQDPRMRGGAPSCIGAKERLGADITTISGLSLSAGRGDARPWGGLQGSRNAGC